VLDNPEGSLSRRLSRRLWCLALLVTIVMGFGPPGTYYVLEVRRLHNVARTHARDIAAQLAAGRPLNLAQVLQREPELLSIRILGAPQAPLEEYVVPNGRRWWNAHAPRAAEPVPPDGSGAPRIAEVSMRQDYVLKTTAAFLALAWLTASVLAVLLCVLPLSVVAQMDARNRRLVAEREALAMIERELTAELERDRLLRLIVDHASALFTGNGAIYLLDGDNKLVPRAWTDGGAFSDVHIPLGQGLVGASAKMRQPLLIDDYPTSPYALPEFVAIGLRSAITQPLLIRDQVLGVIAMNRLGEKARPFSSDDVERLQSFAAQAAIALENARLFAENRRQVETLSVLHELSRAVTGQLEQTALVEAIGREVARVSSVKEIFIILNAAGAEAAPVVALHTPAGRESIDPDKVHKLALMVLQAGRLVRIDAALAGGEVDGGTVADARAWLGVPMSGGNADYGTLLVASDAAFTEPEERLFADIGQLAGLALSSARLFEERGQAYAELAAAQDSLMRAEKLRALGEMASGVAHDFNNLLAAICGRTQLLLGRIDDPVLQRWLLAIKRAADDGAQTVRRLQEFTRIRRDQPFVSVDLNEVIRGALEVTETRWRHEAQSGGIVIAVETALAPLPAISGNPVELREMMTNLILNAVDAMPEGGRLQLSSSADDTEVEAAIEDTGGGMTEEVRQRLFDPFFTTKGPKGTGLGLSITYGIVSRHGGRILVESEPGRGSCFRLRFPLRTVAEEADVSAPEQPLTSIRPLRCLVVDDDEEVASVLADMLVASGHEPVVVTKSTEALTRVASKEFDIVFSDLAMPDMSGWQLARAVKAAFPELPVVLITGFGVELSAEECRANHVDAVMTKPVDFAELMTVAARLTQ
jgi:signal transduction histidine kinase/putative methionine-R-sulfoxide reductase with GAF domain